MTAAVPPGVNSQHMPTSECRIVGRVTLVHTAFGTWIDERVTLGSTAREVKIALMNLIIEVLLANCSVHIVCIVIRNLIFIFVFMLSIKWSEYHLLCPSAGMPVCVVESGVGRNTSCCHV